MAYDYLFTVFTPSYNRAGLLPRLYRSLRAQTFRDFEWLIVDDGSNDDTRAVVAGWQAEAPFPIRYVWQPNGGKHVAFNRAAQEARGELLLEIDSDDEVLPHGLERLARHWADIQALPPAEAARFSGVTGLCQDQRGNLVGQRFPRDVVDSDSNEMKYRYRVTGEKWGFHRTDVFKEFPFPVLPNGGFVPESVVWNAMGRKYKTRYVNEVLRIYWLHDGPRLTTGGITAASAPGQALWHREILNTNLRYFRYDPAEFARSAVHFTRFSLHAGDGFGRQWRNLRGIAPRALWLAAAPLGYLVYRRDLSRANVRTGEVPAATVIR